MKTEWSVSDISQSRPVGSGLSVLEFQSNDGEWHNFDVLETPQRVVFGGYCNTGFLESGYIIREDGERLDETLSELLSDLETFYNDGRQYCSRIVCNDCM